jgi:ribonuclease HI
MHVPSRPLMRSLLSQFQTPTVPRRASRFFRVWLPTGLPRLADHSVYFRLATFYFRQSFQPSTATNLNSCSRDVNAIFAAISNICGRYCGKQGLFSGSQQPHGEKPVPCLDSWRCVAHCCSSKHQRMSNLVAYVDGGSLGNPGPSGIGLVIDGCEKGTIRIQKWIGHQDNNVAEYIALLEALHCALGLSAKALHVFSDSEVVVKQMSGEYACRSPQLYSLNWTCRKLARSLDFSISHVPRENNAEANGLASSAARARGPIPPKPRR